MVTDAVIHINSIIIYHNPLWIWSENRANQKSIFYLGDRNIDRYRWRVFVVITSHSLRSLARWKGNVIILILHIEKADPKSRSVPRSNQRVRSTCSSAFQIPRYFFSLRLREGCKGNWGTWTKRHQRMRESWVRVLFSRFPLSLKLYKVSSCRFISECGLWNLSLYFIIPVNCLKIDVSLHSWFVASWASAWKSQDTALYPTKAQTSLWIYNTCSKGRSRFWQGCGFTAHHVLGFLAWSARPSTAPSIRWLPWITQGMLEALGASYVRHLTYV